MDYPRNAFGLLAISVLIAFVSYFPSLFNEFSSLDDYSYILQNPLVEKLSPAVFLKILTSFTVGNYNPLTVLVFSLERYFFGFDPFYFHFINLLLHLLNSVLIFVFVFRFCARPLMALFVSAFFALHPMHVESVIWVSECKDVLFFFFYLAGLTVYLNFIKSEDGTRRYYFLALILFILSLLSKPAAVSFPLVLLLIDYYFGRSGRKFFVQKIPFFLLSFVFGFVALYAAGTPFASYETAPVYNVNIGFLDKIVLSSFAIWDYLIKAIFPVGLSIFYPYPEAGKNSVLPVVYYACFMGLLSCSWFVFTYARNNKVIVFGLVFFLVTILFNLPFMGVGYSMSGDRFTYLPYLGIFFIIGHYVEQCSAWCLSERKFYVYYVLWVSVVALLVIFAFLTFQRCKVWKNDGTLWADVIKKFPNHSIGYVQLAGYFLKQEDPNAVLALCDKAISLDSKDYSAYFYKGNAYLKMSKLDDALVEYDRAINLFPSYHQAYLNRGMAHILRKEFVLALEDFNKALSFQPEYIAAFLNRAMLHYYQKQFKEALVDFNRVLELDPENKTAKEKVKRLKSMAISMEASP